MFNDRLNELLNDKEVSLQRFQKELTNVSLTNIYSWLEGVCTPLVDKLIQIADFFNCSIEYLIGRTEDIGDEKFKTCPPFDIQLKKILKEKHISQYRLIKDKIVSGGNLDSWLNHKTTMRLENLIKLADYLQVDIDYLLGRV